MNCTAFCYASGLIGFTTPKRTPKVPEGAIEIAKGPYAKLHQVIEVTARHGYGASKGKLLVPGIPEAENDKEKLTALKNFTDIVRIKLQKP